MRTYIVTFYNMSGESLGAVEVCAKSESKAKIAADSLYVCSWVSKTAEVVK